jgi:hypothetical protein
MLRLVIATNVIVLLRAEVLRVVLAAVLLKLVEWIDGVLESM